MPSPNTSSLMTSAAKTEGKLLDVSRFVSGDQSEPETQESSTLAQSPAPEQGSAGISKLIARELAPVYATEALNTRIPDWLDQEIDRAIKEYSLVKQEIITQALMEYLNVQPPHERRNGRSRSK